MNTVRILVLEDHELYRSVLEHNLKSLHCNNITSFSNTPDALDWLANNHSVDIVICDLMMPGQDGLSFLNESKKRGYQIHSVALFSTIEKELRDSVYKMIKSLGYQYLGDLDKTPSRYKLQSIIQRYKALKSQNIKKNKVNLSFTPLNLQYQDFYNASLNQEFVAYFQPKYDICNHEMIGVEALARWNHPHLGTLSPSYFIHELIHHQLIDDMFLQIFQQGIQLQKKLYSKGEKLNISYNLDISQLNDSHVVYKISEMIAEYQVPANLITIEVTESSLISALSTNLENLIRLRIVGCQLAIDDFGVAYSSLARLSSLPFSQVKLDASFISNLATDPKLESIVSSVISLTKDLDMGLIIEGIETEQQLRLVKQLGCDYRQGFYFSKPLSKSCLLKTFFHLI